MSQQEKKVLAIEGYDLDDANLQPIDPFEAMVQPGERVEIEEGDYRGEHGVVQTVGYAGGFYGCIVADVLCDGTIEPERVPQDSVSVVDDLDAD